MSNGAVAGGAAGGAGAAAAVAIANAIKASGAIVRVDPSNFQSILEKAENPLVVCAQGGLFSKTYRYLMSYKGLFFFTKSATSLPLPSSVEVVQAGKIWIPG